MAYYRISKDPSGNEEGVTRQRDDCRRRINSRGWKLVAEHQDNDMSASTGRRRPGFEALLAAVESGQTDVIVAWSLDRLQRNRRDELRLYEICKARGATLSLINGPELDFTTATGEMVADNLGSIARFEVRMKSDRQVAAGRQAAERGSPPRRRAFGYVKGGLKIHPVEGAAVREAFDKLLAGGSIVGITRKLNDAQLRTVGGKEWNPAAVRVMLRNGRYAGIRIYRRTEEMGPGNWPAIVPEEVWRAAVALLDDPARRATLKSNARRWIGAAYYLCGRCGSDMCIGYRQYGDTKTRIYRCRAHLGHLTRVAEPIDAYVSAVIAERLRQPDLAAMLAPPAPDAAPLRMEAKALRLRIEQLADDIGLDEMTLARRVKALRARLADVEGQLAAAGGKGALVSALTAPEPAEFWLGMTDVAARQAVAKELCSVTLLPAPTGRTPFDPDTVKVEWATG